MKTIKYLFFVVLPLGLMACTTADNGETTQARINAFVSNGAAQKAKASNHLSITEAKLLVRDIEFESYLDQDSLDFETGPLVINLNLEGGLTEVAVGDIRPGVYDEIEFDIHKPEDNETPPDSDFRIGDSGDERFSIVIRGTIDGEDFLYRSNENFDIELEFNTPITIEEGNQVYDITLNVDMSAWFMDEQGNPLDPRNFDQVNAIDESIERSFEAFKDEDRDGNEDDDSQGD